ncbi:hypothetical protein QE152_g6829 [Popillia japonica]|uniref:Uncharacterized protein n=1 Tax=Popillia japonica TaxID=7064 RepID=A0AAW1MFS2_POPJA
MLEIDGEERRYPTQLLQDGINATASIEWIRMGSIFAETEGHTTIAGRDKRSSIDRMDQDGNALKAVVLKARCQSIKLSPDLNGGIIRCRKGIRSFVICAEPMQSKQTGETHQVPRRSAR